MREQRKKTHLLVLIGVCTTMLMGMVGFLYLRTPDHSPIPSKYTKGINFTLYYPSHLPNGYWVDKSSFQRRDNVIIFSIKSSNGNNIAVAEQAIPADAPAHNKSSAPINLPGEAYFEAPAGNAHISLWGDKYVSDIMTPEGTWIILNVTGFTVQKATAVSDSFTKLQ